MTSGETGDGRPVRVGVIGAGRCDSSVARSAEAVGASLAAAGAILVCGGLGGVMAAAARGASARGGLVVGLLPGTDAREANPWVRVPLPTGLGHARNVLVVTASEALIALPGEAGTRSEIALAAVFGRPVVALGRPAGEHGVREVATDPDDAVRRALALAASGRSAAR